MAPILIAGLMVYLGGPAGGGSTGIDCRYQLEVVSALFEPPGFASPEEALAAVQAISDFPREAAQVEGTAGPDRIVELPPEPGVGGVKYVIYVDGAPAVEVGISRFSDGTYGAGGWSVCGSEG
jgi:hypothetical protein